jgi:hypothetical protein
VGAGKICDTVVLVENLVRYQAGAVRALCYSFRRGELPEFFTVGRPGPTSQPKKSAARELIVALRKRNYSIYEISEALEEQGTPLSATAVGEVLAAEGFARLPRRRDDETTCCASAP